MSHSLLSFGALVHSVNPGYTWGKGHQIYSCRLPFLFPSPSQMLETIPKLNSLQIYVYFVENHSKFVLFGLFGFIVM